MRNKGLDLRHHSFGRAMRGLDETEVLSFLQATAPDYEQAHADVESLRQQLEETAAELRRLQDQERTVTRLLVAAEEEARVRLEATAQEVAAIERKGEERARALLANAEAQRVKMQEEVRGLVARRSIATSGLTDLIDALSRRAGQPAQRPAAAAPPAPAARIVAPVSAVVVASPVPAPPAGAATSLATPVVATPAVAPAVPATPIVQPVATVHAAPVAPTPPPVTMVPDEPFAADSTESDALSTEAEAPRSNRAWWVAAAGVVLAVTTAAALGFPRIGRVTEPKPSATIKPAAPAPTPKPRPVASDPTDSRPPSPSAAPAVATPSAPLAVTLKANRQCWLRLVVDGRTETKTLAEGEELSRSANREIELRVGDAAAIAVIVNGRALAPLGRNGQVVDTVFHADLSSTH